MKTITYGVTFCSLATLTALQEIHLHSNTQSNDSESSIEGYVLDDSGPVPSVRVAVTELKPSVTTNGVRIAIAGLNSALTTADGHYVIKSSYFRDRTVFLSCRKIGYDCARRKMLSPASSTDVRRLDFRAQKEAVLAGQVLDADKQPVEGIEVDVYVKRFRDGHPIFILQDSDVTTDLGRYRIPNLTQGFD